MTFVYFVLIFGLVVIAHEFGHFLLAKMNGIRVIEFAVGMGPKLLHFKKGETEYCLRLLPIGGACVFDNEDELGGAADKTYEEGSFPAANVWARISTVVAGPIFNFILGFLLAIVIVWFSGSDRPVVNGVMEGYPMEEAGLQAGDVITHMNGERIYLAREIYINTYVNKGKTMEVTYERDGQSYDITVTPKYNEEEDRYLIGLQGYGEYVDCKNANVFPYTYYVLTDGECDPLIMQPQYMPTSVTVKGKFALSHQPVERYYVQGYKGDNDGRVYNITNVNQMMLPTATNEGLAYLNANANAMAQGRKNQITGNVLNGINVVGSAIATGGLSLVGGGVTSVISGVMDIKQTDARNKFHSTRGANHLPQEVKSTELKTFLSNDRNNKQLLDN